jgi:hypothetical protein
MAVSRLSIRAEQSPYRDCEIIVSEPENSAEPCRATCIDGPTGTVIGSRSFPHAQRDGQTAIDPNEIIRMVGGVYRLASIAVDIETDLLRRRTRRIADILRLRRRLWRRSSRSRVGQQDH